MHPLRHFCKVLLLLDQCIRTREAGEAFLSTVDSCFRLCFNLWQGRECCAQTSFAQVLYTSVNQLAWREKPIFIFLVTELQLGKVSWNLQLEIDFLPEIKALAFSQIIVSTHAEQTVVRTPVYIFYVSRKFFYQTPYQTREADTWVRLRSPCHQGLLMKHSNSLQWSSNE